MIVQAALTLLAFLGLSVFVVDYGVLWVGRAQAQNAADAGAVAGAVARAYDDLEDPPSASAGIVHDSVTEVVLRNPVWFNAAFTRFGLSYACPPGADRCVRVDVYRDGTSGSVTLPTFFGPVLGIQSQRVRATATAQVAVGNGTTCLKPWAIPDTWLEQSSPLNGNFERYADGTGAIVMNPDVYDPPTMMGAGSGFTFGADLGLPLTLSFADPEGNEPISSGFLLPLVLPGATYEENIAGCNGGLVAFGRQLETGTSAMEVPTTDGFADLIASDPGASWNPATNNVEGSCAPGCALISPRLVAVAVFDVAEYQLRRATGAPCDGGFLRCVNAVNIVGLFIEGVAGGVITCRIARYPGLVYPGNQTLSTASSFLPAITLVR